MTSEDLASAGRMLKMFRQDADEFRKIQLKMEERRICIQRAQELFQIQYAGSFDPNTVSSIKLREVYRGWGAENQRDLSDEMVAVILELQSVFIWVHENQQTFLIPEIKRRYEVGGKLHTVSEIMTDVLEKTLSVKEREAIEADISPKELLS